MVTMPAKDSERPISSGESSRPVGVGADAKIGNSELKEMLESWKMRYVDRRRMVSRLKISLLERWLSVCGNTSGMERRL